MKQILNRQSLVSAYFFLGLVFFANLVNANAQSNQTLFGITTGNQLVQFNTSAVDTLTTVGPITGLQVGENIVGIDFRPATGELFGLGSSSRLYIINRTTRAATAVGPQFPTLLTGTNFGFDFNPTVDRIRVVSDSGQNLRLNPNNGAVTVDGNLNPGTPQATAAAYTNSFGVSATTTLYDIDTTTDRLLIQSNPNAGTLTDVGPLGLDFQSLNGFDVASSNAGGTSTTIDTAFAAAPNSIGGTVLYTIDLTTGAATSVGVIGGNTALLSLRGLAAATTGVNRALNLLDFGGDRRTDYTNFRFSNNFVYISRPDGSNFGFPFGSGDDTFAPGDYDFDGRTDLAVFRNSTGTFFVQRSSDNTVVGFQFGAPGDEPVARDYDGDGRTDYAVVRREGVTGTSDGTLTWFIRNSSDGSFSSVQFGFATDVVAPGDYDGDGRFDIAVYRGVGDQPATFFVQRSSGGFTAVQFGVGSDLVVPGDYDGDGRTDYAVVRTGTTYFWYMLRSADNSLLTVPLGTKPHLTVQSDYDGDGKTDVAVWNPLNGFYYIARSSTNFTSVASVQFGQNGDYPVANFDTH